MPIPELHDLDLSSPHGKALLRAVAQRHGAPLADVATRLDRMFLLRSPWAPGLRFVGALARSPILPPGSPDTRISFAGGGESIEEAFVSCVGEAVERLSQFERMGDARPQRIADVTDQIRPSVERVVGQQCGGFGDSTDSVADWMSARNLASGSANMVPADWILRRGTDGILRDRAGALSTGAAAGPDFETAAVCALLELVERDAAALWWLGGRRARPLSAESRGLAEAVRLANVLRQDAANRSTWLLDITSDLGIPTIAAISVDANGWGFVCGLAARFSPADAVRSALTELCQLEIGLLLARAKREQGGEAALTEIDRRHLQRADTIDTEACALIHPTGPPRSHREPETETPATGGSLARMTDVLAAAGIEALVVDLTRAEFAIPVVKAIAPELQALPSDLKTDRLLDAVASTGGGERWTGGTPLT